MDEFEFKQARLRDLLESHHLDALLLRRVSSFAWATCGGASYINTASTFGIASLLVTPTARYLITDNIEARRLADEQQLAAQGWEFRVAPWYASGETIANLTQGLKLGADSAYIGAEDLSSEMALLRAALTPDEIIRMRALGQLCAAAMESAVRTVRPGMTEFEIAAQLDCETEQRGAQAIVNLIATDWRISTYRHPLPTDKQLECYAMLVLCGRKWGLVASITRFVYFGRLPDELRRKGDACAQVDAAMIAATRPHKTLGAIFSQAVAAYDRLGFAEEWQLHHQGGLAGYEPREAFGLPGSNVTVVAGNACAWNPSIAGVKSEDTILVGEHGNEIITATPGLPTVSIEVDGQTLARPAILEFS